MFVGDHAKSQWVVLSRLGALARTPCGKASSCRISLRPDSRRRPDPLFQFLDVLVFHVILVFRPRSWRILSAEQALLSPVSNIGDHQPMRSSRFGEGGPVPLGTMS